MLWLDSERQQRQVAPDCHVLQEPRHREDVVSMGALLPVPQVFPITPGTVSLGSVGSRHKSGALMVFSWSDGLACHLQSCP